MVTPLEAATARDDPGLHARLRSERRERQPWCHNLGIALVGLAVGTLTMLAFTWSVWVGLLGLGIQGVAVSAALEGSGRSSEARGARSARKDGDVIITTWPR